MNLSERTLVRVYVDGQGRMGYSKMVSQATSAEMAQLLVMVRMLAKHLEDEYEDLFLQASVLDDAEEARIRKLIDINPDPNEPDPE